MRESAITRAKYSTRAHITHYPLERLLPDGACLAFNVVGRILSLLVVNAQGMPEVVEQCSIAPAETLILLPMLEMYPDYCPYEVLYASVTYGNASEESVGASRTYLQDVLDGGTSGRAWDRAFRPIVNVVTRLRPRLYTFHLTISSVREAGYSFQVRDDKKPWT